jgi:anti-anti-sigma factor
MGKARAVEEVTGAAHGDQQRTVPLELSHRISLAGEAIVDLGGELDIASAEVAVSYVRDIVDRHRRPVIVDLTALAFCNDRGLGALVRTAGYAERMGCTFRLASPSLSLVKIMRITGLDRRFLAFQVPEQAASLRLPWAVLMPDQLRRAPAAATAKATRTRGITLARVTTPSNRSDRMRHQRPGRHAESSASLTREATAARRLRSSRHQPTSQLTRTRRRIQHQPGQRFASRLPLTGPVREVPEHG